VHYPNNFPFLTLIELSFVSLIDFDINYFSLLLVHFFYFILRIPGTFSINFHRYLSSFFLSYLFIIDSYKNYSCLMIVLIANSSAKIYVRKYYSYPHLFPSIFTHNYSLFLQFTSISINETFQCPRLIYYSPLLQY
jgi:hypothetical protein